LIDKLSAVLESWRDFFSAELCDACGGEQVWRLLCSYLATEFCCQLIDLFAIVELASICGPAELCPACMVTTLQLFTGSFRFTVMSLVARLIYW
jgi:hypothetical protein